MYVCMCVMKASVRRHTSSYRSQQPYRAMHMIYIATPAYDTYIVLLLVRIMIVAQHIIYYVCACVCVLALVIVFVYMYIVRNIYCRSGNNNVLVLGYCNY
jgi:hypothetical protein